MNLVTVRSFVPWSCKFYYFTVMISVPWHSLLWHYWFQFFDTCGSVIWHSWVQFFDTHDLCSLTLVSSVLWHSWVLVLWYAWFQFFDTNDNHHQFTSLIVIILITWQSLIQSLCSNNYVQVLDSHGFSPLIEIVWGPKQSHIIISWLPFFSRLFMS